MACRGHEQDRATRPTCSFAEITLMPKEYLKCSANHDSSRIRWLPRNSKKVVLCWERIMSEWTLRCDSHTFIVVEALPGSGLARTSSELQAPPTSSRAPDRVHARLAMTVLHSAGPRLTDMSTSSPPLDHTSNVSYLSHSLLHLTSSLPRSLSHGDPRL